MTCHYLSDKIKLTKNSHYEREYLMSIPFKRPLAEYKSVIISLLCNMYNAQALFCRLGMRIL